MIESIIKLTAMYVLIGGFTRFAFKGGAMITKFLFWIGLVLIVMGTIGPRLNQVASDFHEFTKAYTNTVNGVSTAYETVTSLPDRAENIPLVGTGPSKFPPALTLGEKLWPWGKKFFDWPVNGELTQGFSDKNHGLDIAAKEGAPIAAAREGKVVAISSNDVYGNFVVLDHSGQWQTLYAHLGKVAVGNGQHVFGGNLIGSAGSTGNSTGSHLHFEVRKGGKAINPEGMMK